MRKCPTCGYLLLGDGDTCKHCGAALPLVSVAVAPVGAEATAAAPVAPPARLAPVPPATDSGPRIWTPPPVTAPPPSPLGATPPPAGMAPPVWRPAPVPVIVRTPRPSFAQRVLAACVLLAMVAAGVGGYNFLSSRADLPAGTSAFVHGNGVAYADPDGVYTAEFPKAPAVDSSNVSLAGGDLTVTTASVEADDYEVGVIVGALPVAIPTSQVDSSMKDLTADAISGTQGTVESQTRGTRGAAATLETRFKMGDGYAAHILVMMTGSHIYVLYVHAKTGADRLYSALDKSFQARAF